MGEMNGKKAYLIVGMARSGVAAAKMLAEKGMSVIVNDVKTKEQLGGALEPLNGYENIEQRLGEDPLGLLDRVSTMVISPGIPWESPMVQSALAAGVEVIGEIELSARVNRGMLIGITGTNGKTTTTALTGEILKEAGFTTHVVGNIGYPFAAVAGDTRPEDRVVCEVSSFQLESVKDFRPHVAVITNLREDHLNRHHTMACYHAMKARIFARQTEDDFLVLNYEDKGLRRLADTTRARVVWFSSEREVPVGTYVRDGVITYTDGETHTPVCPAEDLLIPGQHNLDNALGAAAAAICAGANAEACARAMRSFKGIGHRMELVRVLDGVSYIDDTEGTNADSTVQAVRAMKADTVIILGGSLKDNDFTELCEAIRDSGRIAHTVLIGQTARQFDETLRKVGYPKERIHHLGTDFRAAIEAARSLASPGGTVLRSPA